MSLPPRDRAAEVSIAKATDARSRHDLTIAKKMGFGSAQAAMESIGQKEFLAIVRVAAPSINAAMRRRRAV
jgi:hypothetical protein